MSQLDISISFSHLIIFLVLFYLFCYLISLILEKFWYSKNFRYLINEEGIKHIDNMSSNLILRKILKL